MGAGCGRGRVGEQMAYESEQGLHSRTGDTGVAAHDRDVGVEVDRGAHLLGVVAVRAVELVDRDDETEAALLEEVDGRETVLQSPGVGEDHRAERALGEFVPHEPEPLLSGRSEQIEDVLRVQGDAAEVHRHGGLDLVLDAFETVGRGTHRGEQFLRAERRDLAHRADQGRLADSEPSRHQDLQGGGKGVRAVVVVHRALPPEETGQWGCGRTRAVSW